MNDVYEANALALKFAIDGQESEKELIGKAKIYADFILETRGEIERGKMDSTEKEMIIARMKLNVVELLIAKGGVGQPENIIKIAREILTFILEGVSK